MNSKSLGSVPPQTGDGGTHLASWSCMIAEGDKLVGTILAVRGSVMDARFPQHIPQLNHRLSSLIRQYLFVSLDRAIAESLAAENAAHLAAMQAAEKNVDDRLDELNARYHRRRQSTITEEPLDVSAGFEVLKG